MAAKQKTTMSVLEMRRMLGLKKTDSYWLVHKNCFKTITVAGQMRIVISSFEEWYASQTHYRKVDGPDPGEALNADSYSVHDLSKMLGISTDSVYELLKKKRFKTFTRDNVKRIEKSKFDRWLKRQTHYRTPEQREHDREMEENSMSLPEMGRLIGLSRDQAYALADRTPELEIITIAGRRRVTKDSFDKWYSNQNQYRKKEDLPELERREHVKKHWDETFGKNAGINQGYSSGALQKEWYSVKETASILEISETAVLRLIRSNVLSAEKFNRSWRIFKNDIVWFLKEQQNEHKGEKKYGIDC